MRPDVEEKRRKIVKTIISKGPQGISDLVKEIKYDKKTIIKYCRELKEAGIIKKNGRFGKYQLASNAYQYPSLSARIFQSEAMKALFEVRRITFRDSRIDENEFFKNQISNFAITIGSMITYCLIQSMAPKAWNLEIDNFPFEQRILKNDRKMAMMEWIKNCINPLQILIEFCNLRSVRRGLHRGRSYPPPPLHILLANLKSPIYADRSKEEIKALEGYVTEHWNELTDLYNKNKKNDMNPHDPYQSGFQLNDETFDSLMITFQELYPDIYNKLEKIRHELHNKVNRQISLSKTEFLQSK